MHLAHEQTAQAAQAAVIAQEVESAIGEATTNNNDVVIMETAMPPHKLQLQHIKQLPMPHKQQPM
jgi:hypothetical protein